MDYAETLLGAGRAKFVKVQQGRRGRRRLEKEKNNQNSIL